MVKELLHICRTYSITYRYLKKNEVYFFVLIVYFFIFYFLFFLVF